jgi:hypothetical protein
LIATGGAAAIWTRRRSRCVCENAEAFHQGVEGAAASDGVGQALRFFLHVCEIGLKTVPLPPCIGGAQFLKRERQCLVDGART